MRAAVIGVDRGLAVADIERPAPAVGEVLIDVRYCGICGSWSAGERVVVLPMVACRRCHACRAGRSNLCERGGIDGAPGIGRPGGYAESVAVPARMLRRLS